MALLKLYGSHNAWAVVPKPDGSLLYQFCREDSDWNLFMKVRELLHREFDIVREGERDE